MSEMEYGSDEHLDGLSRDALKAEVRWWHECALEMEAENAKLRTFLGGGSIVTDYWKDEDGTMHVLTTDGEQTYEYMRGGLAEENAKLRELVRGLWWCTEQENKVQCERCPLGTVKGDRLALACEKLMDELGVEV